MARGRLCSIHTAVARLTGYFSEPRQVITLTAEAESWHLSYQGAMNVQSHVVRESGDVQAGARFGAAPWQVGVLAALLLVFEIFVGAHSVEALQAKALQITSHSICNVPTLFSSSSSSGFKQFFPVHADIFAALIMLANFGLSR